MKKEKIYEWFDLAELCEENYGIQVDYEEKFFICCDCGEPIYFEDWKNDKHFLKGQCPVCGYVWTEDFE